MATGEVQYRVRVGSETKEKEVPVYFCEQGRKLIVTVQKCPRCGGTFGFDHRRHRCPRCNSVLRSKIMVLKAR